MKSTKKMILLAMFSAIAYVVMLVGRLPLIPGVEFLKYDPKDIVLVISGFIFGPLSCFIVTAIVSLIEMLTASETGIIGLLMNILSSAAFACTAAFIYKKYHTLGGAIGGLIAGTISMTAIMIAWNYIVTPFYMGVPREQVAAMLIPTFLPFNLLKAIINTTITLIIYKPITKALRMARVIGRETKAQKSKLNIAEILVSAMILVTCILVVYYINL